MQYFCAFYGADIHLLRLKFRNRTSVPDACPAGILGIQQDKRMKGNASVFSDRVFRTHSVFLEIIHQEPAVCIVAHATHIFAGGAQNACRNKGGGTWPPSLYHRAGCLQFGIFRGKALRHDQSVVNGRPDSDNLAHVRSSAPNTLIFSAANLLTLSMGPSINKSMATGSLDVSNT